MSLVKQLAPRWKLNAVISQANAPLSVLLPVKNGSDKIPAVSIALEIWTALNGGKQTVLLLYFLQLSPKIIQRGLMELDRLLAWFLFCIAGLLSEPLIPAALLACAGEAKKAWIPDPGECPALTECDIFQVSQPNTEFSPKLLCLSGCQWTWWSTLGEQVPGNRKEVWNHLDLGGELGWQSLTHSQPFSPHLRASSFPAWFSDTISPRTSFPQCSFLVITWTPSTLKPQERAGAQSHHS